MNDIRSLSISKANVSFFGELEALPSALKVKKEGRLVIKSYEHLSEIQSNESEICFLTGRAIKALLYGFPVHTTYTFVDLSPSVYWIIGFPGLLRRLFFLKNIFRKETIQLDSKKWLVLQNKSFRKARRHLSLSEEVGVRGFIEHLKQHSVNYVVLRFFDGLLEKDLRGKDIDILVSDDDSEVVRNFLEKNSGSIHIDLFSVSGLAKGRMPYYPPPLSREILKYSIENAEGVRIPSDKQYFLSLAYHALYHKGFVSKIPTEMLKSADRGESDNKYMQKLSTLGHRLGINVEYTMEDLDEYLADEGWRPHTDTLFKISQTNEWVRKRFFGKPDRKKGLGLGVIIIRQGALRRFKEEDIVSSVREESDFQILYTEKFKENDIHRIADGIRGGNWSGREEKAGDLLPAMAIVVVDKHTLKRSQAGLVLFEFGKRIRDLKIKLRKRLDGKGTSFVHATDNTVESFEYIDVCFPSQREHIQKQIDEIIEALKPKTIDTIKMFFKSLPGLLRYYKKETKFFLRNKTIELLER